MVNVIMVQLWQYRITFGIMAFSAIAFALLTFRRPMYDRKHGYLTILIVLVAMTAYYTMASRGGDAEIRLYWRLSYARDVWYARYIDWFVTTPLLLLDLLMIAAVPVGTALWILTADVFMILLGLFGAISTHKYRWGWYAIGCFFEFVLTWGMLVTAPRYAFKRSRQIGWLYLGLAIYLNLLWFGYPVVWGLAEGSNTISEDAEIASYAGLDIAAKAVFGFLLMLIGQPIISKQLEKERAESKSSPSMLEAPVNAPLSSVVSYVAVPKGHMQEPNVPGTVPVTVHTETTSYQTEPVIHTDAGPAPEPLSQA